LTSNLVGHLGSNSGITFFSNGLSDTLVSWERYQRFIAFSKKEDVGQSCGESMASGVFDIDDIEGTWMFFTGLDGTNSTDVLTADDHTDVTGIEFNPVGDFSGSDVDFYGVTDHNVWVGVTDGAAVVGGEEWNVVLSQDDVLYSAEFVRSFFSSDSVNDVASFGIKYQSEVFVGLIESDNIHETGWVFDIGSYFTIDFNHLAHHDFLAFASSKSILQTVSDENGQRQALTEFVWASVGSE